MNLDECKLWLGPNYVLHPDYQPQAHHSCYALVDVKLTFHRVNKKLKEGKSFIQEVEKIKTNLRLIHGKTRLGAARLGTVWRG